MVREVWARVAEDYAPFDVDVTTQQPATGGLVRTSLSDATYGTRVAFTGGAVQQAICSSCGGIAWIGTFDDTSASETRSPAWVFPSAIGNRAKFMAEAASHEAGHTLGLNHDGTTATNGAYYSGTALWGPIMGSPYDSRVTQWSRGDYARASNHEDDLAVITATGLPYRPDEAGQTTATAGGLTDAGSASGVVAGKGDQDWYAVDDCTGTLTATATPAAVGPDLDIRLDLRDAAGTVLATSAPATAALGSGDLGAWLSVPRTGGPYYLAVSGGGSGAGGASGWSTGGYDAYGSLGAYRLAMGGCSGLARCHLLRRRPPGRARPRVRTWHTASAAGG
ncbi:MAG TPA: zinc-dependent metalloprotease family protein [Nocardioides sp.]|nr:zinc-dependent metalloprotease family protein [Nocardioides sp.]